jgi:hypothetical protein
MPRGSGAGERRRSCMNDEPNNLDKNDLDTLEVTDEALEAAATPKPTRYTIYLFPIDIYC